MNTPYLFINKSPTNENYEPTLGNSHSNNYLIL